MDALHLKRGVSVNGLRRAVVYALGQIKSSAVLTHPMQVRDEDFLRPIETLKKNNYVTMRGGGERPGSSGFGLWRGLLGPL